MNYLYALITAFGFAVPLVLRGSRRRREREEAGDDADGRLWNQVIGLGVVAALPFVLRPTLHYLLVNDLLHLRWPLSAAAAALFAGTVGVRELRLLRARVHAERSAAGAARALGVGEQ